MRDVEPYHGFTTEAQLHGNVSARERFTAPPPGLPTLLPTSFPEQMQFRGASIDGAAGYFPDRVRHASGCVLTYNDGFCPIPVRIAGLQGTLRPPGTRFGDEITIRV